MTPTDAARQLLDTDHDHPMTRNALMAKYGPAIARALLDAEAKIYRLRAELQEIARVTGCLNPNENGRPACNPECVACRQFPEATGKAGG